MDAGRAEPSDAVLMERLCRGDEQALADLYDGYARLVHALALRVVRDRRTAEDVTQEVFVHLWKHPHRFDARRGSLRAFVATIAHGRAVDAVRRDAARRVREERSTPEPELAPDPADTVAQTYDTHWVRSAVARLPAAQRAALELAYFRGRTYRQVADELGIPEGTAKSRLRLGLQSIGRARDAEMSERWT